MDDGAVTGQAQATAGQTTRGDGAVFVAPSGQEVTLLETLWNVPGPEGIVTRFRFLAPAINPATAPDGKGIDFAAAAADLAWLCDSFARETVVQAGPLPAQIILSFEDRPLPFGEAAPDAVQFFEAFRIENNTCIWEAY
jgi:hypothetical protein